jgi:hypothetical protein
MHHDLCCLVLSEIGVTSNEWWSNDVSVVLEQSQSKDGSGLQRANCVERVGHVPVELVLRPSESA